jgi:hypothetical protein
LQRTMTRLEKNTTPTGNVSNTSFSWAASWL